MWYIQYTYLDSEFLALFVCFTFPSSHFSFLVFGHFWQQSYENTKILQNLCLHFARQDGQDGNKNGKKITQLNWPKYQNPKDEKMGCMKQKSCKIDNRKIPTMKTSLSLFLKSHDGLMRGGPSLKHQSLDHIHRTSSEQVIKNHSLLWFHRTSK